MQPISVENPFLESTGQPQVYISGGHGPYDNTRQALSNIDLSSITGKRVLLKPNVGRVAVSGSGIITEAQVVAAAVDAFQEAGATVAIGESPITGVKTFKAFEVAGISEIARQRNCQLIDMDKKSYKPVGIEAGAAIQSLRVCQDLFDFDVIVSIPVMKTHMHTGVTLSVKNMKGCLWRRSKVKLHMLPAIEGRTERPIDIAISDMSGVLKPHLAIIDGTVGMEGLGPGAGTPKPMDVVVVSSDPFAADAVACRLMGIEAEDVVHLNLAAKKNYGVIDLNQIKVFPDNWTDFVSAFELPPKTLSVKFPNVNILDKNSCSACQSTLLLFLEQDGKKIFDYFPKGARINMAMGKGHESVPDGTVCIGNCTKDHQEIGIFVPGCPPVGSKILDIISGNPPTEEQGDI